MTPNNNNNKQIPTLRATFDPTNPLEGMFVVSLVEDPAIGSLFFPFGEEKINLSILDAPQHKVIGCVLRADYPILRIDGEGKYYNLVFDKETIYELTQHFVKYNNTGNVSVLHNGKPVDGVELTQLFIKDKSKGIDPVGFDEVSDGSLFAEYKILNEEVWKGICNGVYRGFSIEGVFELAPVKMQKVNQDKNQDKNKLNIFNMSKLRDKLAKMLLKFDSISTDKADLFYDHEGELVVGDEVYTYNESGDRVPVADGEYLSDNIVYDIENSKVTEIKRFETPDPAKEDLEAMPADPVAPEATPEATPEAPATPDPKVADPEGLATLESKVTELESKVTELVSKVEELAAKIETPVVEPIAEVFSAATTRTNDSRATRLAELGSALR